MLSCWRAFSVSRVRSRSLSALVSARSLLLSMVLSSSRTRLAIVLHQPVVEGGAVDRDGDAVLLERCNDVRHGGFNSSRLALLANLKERFALLGREGIEKRSVGLLCSRHRLEFVQDGWL